jgi:glutamate-5-semialdehyde dehydrogenase
MSGQPDIVQLATQAHQAATVVASLSTETKNACLMDLARWLESNSSVIIAANKLDMNAAKAAGLGEAKLRRLALTPGLIGQMATGLRQVAGLDDPVGRVTREYQASAGLDVKKVRCPLGVIMMIYEARPNVTIDAFALCFKSGNACILKGGSEAARSNEVLVRLAGESLTARGVSPDVVTLITSSDREAIKGLLQLHEYIDLVIPRGATELIRFVHEHSRIPMVQHFQGVCHIFVDQTADIAQAIEICVTAKAAAPATCNAAECILVHEAIAPDFVPALAQRMQEAHVEVRGDAGVCKLTDGATAAREDDWGREFLDLIVAVKIVVDIDGAIEHIRRYGSNHTEAILTRDEDNARRFVAQVQSSCVLVNASTRFNDGFQLGLGAEIGISTSKLHAYGPMGLEELTTQRYVVHGNGQTR